MRRFAVVGDGISGLVAAYRLRQALGDEATIDLFGAGDHPGGILKTVPVGGAPVDVGAEAFIVRRPEALGLVTELGLADQVVSPTANRPAIWADGRLHAMPTGALMGIPADADSVIGLVDAADRERIAGERHRPLSWAPGTDVSVGDLVTERYGPSVVARCVDPMLGGVYSSLAADIGLREAIPALAARLDAGAPSLSAAVTEVLGLSRGVAGPVFGTLQGGYRVLVEALLAAAHPHLRSGSTVTDIERSGARWTLLTAQGSADAGPAYDGVVLAVPAWAAGAILRRTDADLAAQLRAVQGASSVVASMAFAPDTPVPQHSGVLVATGESLRAKAFTLSSRKWAHLMRPDRPVSVRASFGRYGAAIPEEDAQPGITEQITGWALADFDEVCGAAGLPAPSGRLVDIRLQRWTNGLPVYAPGHLTRMAAAIAACPPGLALAGASYAGVGVPACVGRAGRAVTEVLGALD